MNKLVSIICLIVCTVMCSPPNSIAEDTGHQNDTKSRAQIVFQGKLFCSLKRPVIMPFTGIYTDIRITPGQLVKKDEPLALYTLEEDKAIELGREILFEHLDDLNRQLAIEKQKIVELERKEQELIQLTAEKLSPPYALEKIRVQLRFTRTYVSLLEKRLSQARQLSDKGLDYIRKLLGNNSLEPGQIPEIVTLKAPISGVVLTLHPEFKESALLQEWTPVAQIGKMDVMLIRSLVYERDATRMKIGDTVHFLPDALPGKKFDAVIRSIDWTPANPDPDQPSYYRVEMTIDNHDMKLRDGFKGRIEFTLPKNRK